VPLLGDRRVRREERAYDSWDDLALAMARHISDRNGRTATAACSKPTDEASRLNPDLARR